MKNRFLFVGLFLFFTNIIVAQEIPVPKTDLPKETDLPEEVEQKPVPMQLIEEIPMFPGCENVDKKSQMDCFNDRMYKHIKKTLIYPEEASDLGVSDRVIVVFLINKDGSVTVTHTKSTQGSNIFEAEARRVIEKLPKFKPGTQKGKPVTVKYTIPINFMTSIEQDIKK